MTRQELILKELQEVYDKLNSIFVDLQIENNETQFDFCTNAELENLYSNVENVVGRIGQIVYQR